MNLAPARVPLQHHTIVVLGLMCLFALGAGAWALLKYSGTPGAVGEPPRHWPATSQIQRDPQHATLIMVAHPRCPCTRASLGELARLMAQCQGRLTAYVILPIPAGAAGDWEQTDLWRSARIIPGVTALCDPGSVQARSFGVETSGHTLLYDTRGRLIFSGGITESRGHEGDNAGHSAIVDLLVQGSADISASPVFGCPLFAAESAASNQITLCKVPLIHSPATR